MAECPKCAHHLRLRDWKQKCPYCGANIVMYNLQERLMQDADKAEVEYYYHQKKMDRVKASFIGSPLAIVRIFTSLLPVGALFLPLLKLASSALPPKLSVIQLYNAVSEDAGGLFSALRAAGTGGTLLLASLGALALSVLLLVLHFVFLFLSCSPHGKARNYTLSILQMMFAAAFPALLFCVPQSGLLSAAPAFGAFLYAALSAANLVLDILVFRQGIEIKHAQCYVGGIPIEEYFEMQKNGVPQEELRAEMYRRLTAIQQEKERELAEKLEAEKASKTEVTPS